MTLINITTTLPTSTQTSSNGAWQGDNPLNHAFPLLIIQTTIVVIITRFLAFLLKPLRQPKVIAEILGGILLGPSALGRNKAYLSTIFPTWSTRILESVASIGLLFFLFLVGLELDLTTIRGSGRRAFGIAIVGLSLPFICGIGITILLRKTVEGAQDVGYGQFLVFIGVALSITAFPVLARILAELKLLTTQVGETALAAAALNDVVAWVLLALAVALAGKGTGGGDDHTNPLVSIWILFSGIAFVVFMLVMVRPAMNWVGKRCLSGNKPIHEGYICLTLAGVMLSGLTTDLIGIHSIFGSFVFGLMIPKEGEFAGKLIERIEDFVSGLLLPLYFASSGLKTNVGKIHGLEAWGLLVLVIATACAGKILGTFVVAMLHKIPPRESLTLGVLMNTKGLVELIVLNIGKEKKVLNDEIFAILILMALFTTFMTTPTVIAIYRPARVVSSHTHRRLQRESMLIEADKELRILACVYDPGNVSSLVKLIESTRCTKKFQLKLYTMHLVELTERSSSILMARRARKNGHPSRDHSLRGEIQGRVAIAFETNSQLGRVKVRSMTAISALPTMHEDICHVAEEKRVTMVILPFHKQGIDEGDVAMEDMGPGWRGVNQRVLKDAPCSVAVLVDRSLGSGTHRVCLLFFGGPDDREALELVERMVQHPTVRVTVVRFVEREETEGNGVILRQTLESTEISSNSSTAVMDREGEKELDKAMVSEFRRKWDKVNYEEMVDSNIVEKVLEIGRREEYELIVVGKGRFPYRVMAEQAANRAVEHPELGPVGDILASSTNGVVSSVLVVQQYDSSVHANDEMARISSIVDGDDTINNTCTTSTTPSV